MKNKTKDENLKRLRNYIARENSRLSETGGHVHKIDLDKIDENAIIAISGKRRDPLERDLDALFQPSVKE